MKGIVALTATGPNQRGEKTIDSVPETPETPEIREPGSTYAGKPQSVEELTRRNIVTVANLEDATARRRSRVDCVVDAIAAFCGSMSFVYVHLVWFGAWVLLNAPKPFPKSFHFDPFPFQLLTLVVSLEAIFLSTFLLINQNRQAAVADRRNLLDLQINLLSEQENTKMLSMLDKIMEHLGIQDDDPDVRVLEEATRPDSLLDEIEEITHRHDKKRMHQAQLSRGIHNPGEKQ